MQSAITALHEVQSLQINEIFNVSLTSVLSFIHKKTDRIASDTKY
jgi:hypothetical protein